MWLSWCCVYRGLLEVLQLDFETEEQSDQLESQMFTWRLELPGNMIRDEGTMRIYTIQRDYVGIAPLITVGNVCFYFWSISFVLWSHGTIIFKLKSTPQKNLILLLTLSLSLSLTHSHSLSLSLSLALSLVMFYKGVWEAWTFQNEITLVWQVFVMLCVKSFDYKATLTALINDLCVFVLSVFLWVYMCVNCPEALCHFFCSLISSYRPLPLVKPLQNLPWHSFYEDTHVIPKAIHMHPFSTSSPAAIQI